MATEFKILRGNKSTLIDENGNSKLPEEKLVNGYWYLTNDTAEVYVCLNIDGHLVLKKINECDTTSDWDEVRIEDIEARLTALEADHTHTYGYRQGFPTAGELNHIYVAEDQKRTYIFTSNGYLPIADKFDMEDHDSNPDTPEVRIIYGGSAE